MILLAAGNVGNCTTALYLLPFWGNKSSTFMPNKGRKNLYSNRWWISSGRPTIIYLSVRAISVSY
jgi:hypothetical protein